MGGRGKGRRPQHKQSQSHQPKAGKNTRREEEEEEEEEDEQPQQQEHKSSAKAHVEQEEVCYYELMGVSKTATVEEIRKVTMGCCVVLSKLFVAFVPTYENKRISHVSVTSVPSKAYKKLAIKLHPDRNPDAGDKVRDLACRLRWTQL